MKSVHVAILVALICQGVGIVLYVSWIWQSNWNMSMCSGLYTSRPGPPFLILSAMASLALGVCATLAGVACRAANTSEQRATTKGRNLLVILMLAASVLSLGICLASWTTTKDKIRRNNDPPATARPPHTRPTIQQPPNTIPDQPPINDE